MKLLEHLEAMQGRVAYYLAPLPQDDKGYVDVHGKAHGYHPHDVDKAFVTDMVHLLDGPEQREAQEEAERIKVEHAQAAEWRMDLRTQISQADAVAKGANERAKALEAEVNELRSRLMTSELAYAKLRGYLDRVVDEQPPVMVPQQREPMHAQMPDGSRGTEYGGWHGGDSDRDRRWYYR